MGHVCFFVLPITADILIVSQCQAVLNLDEVLRDVLAWDMYAVLASDNGGGWGRAAQQAPRDYPDIDTYVKVVPSRL